jgi:hypothetical protein
VSCRWGSDTSSVRRRCGTERVLIWWGSDSCASVRRRRCPSLRCAVRLLTRLTFCFLLLPSAVGDVVDLGVAFVFVVSVGEEARSWEAVAGRVCVSSSCWASRHGRFGTVVGGGAILEGSPEAGTEVGLWRLRPRRFLEACLVGDWAFGR